jgi:nitroreductase
MAHTSLHELITRRWSPVQFDDRPVEQEKLIALFEAARWAPSSYNEQPWRFIVGIRDAPGTESETWNKLLDTLVEANQTWARHAPVLAISVAKLKFEKNGKPNRHAWHDVGLAAGQLLTQATALDLSVHQMAGFNASAARAAFAIPDDHEPVAAMAIGYHGPNPQLPDDVRRRDAGQRQRQPLDAMVFSDRWGRSASLAH